MYLVVRFEVWLLNLEILQDDYWSSMLCFQHERVYHLLV